MSIGERIAKVLAPEAVTLTTEYVTRLRASHDQYKRDCAYMRRENKRLLKEVMKYKRMAGK